MNVETWLSKGAERVVETHCARVFLGPELAWKIKRAVDLGYLDFSTLEKRRWALERELAFNAAAAPGIYRAVRAVTRTADGLAFDGEGPVVEYALEMRRFDETAVLDVHPEALTPEVAEVLGRTIARLQAAAPASAASAGEALAYTAESNAAHLRALAGRLGEEAVERLAAATTEALTAAEPLLAVRGGLGLVRRCHGDLHLGNILLETGAPVLFDCIEFSDRLSEIDVVYDLAFLLMDLEVRHRRGAAARVLSAWLDEGHRAFPAGLCEGLALLPLMMSVRAAVRCHVRAQAGDLEQARAYLAAAEALLAPPVPALVAIGGYSGSGKSTFARELAPLLGAVILRSDEIRKRQWGAAPSERLPPEAYAAAAGERVYGRMFEEARACLRAGRAVVLDAVFLKPAERERAADLARACGIPFEGVWLEAPETVLRERVAGRTGDASDADLAVLSRQLSQAPGGLGWRRLDAREDFGQMARALASGLGD